MCQVCILFHLYSLVPYLSSLLPEKTPTPPPPPKKKKFFFFFTISPFCLVTLIYRGLEKLSSTFLHGQAPDAKDAGDGATS